MNLRDKAMPLEMYAKQVRDPQPRMPEDVLWLWGRMRDFERDVARAAR